MYTVLKMENMSISVVTGSCSSNSGTCSISLLSSGDVLKLNLPCAVSTICWILGKSTAWVSLSADESITVGVTIAFHSAGHFSGSFSKHVTSCGLNSWCRFCVSTSALLGFLGLFFLRFFAAGASDASSFLALKYGWQTSNSPWMSLYGDMPFENPFSESIMSNICLLFDMKKFINGLKQHWLSCGIESQGEILSLSGLPSLSFLFLTSFKQHTHIHSHSKWAYSLGLVQKTIQHKMWMHLFQKRTNVTTLYVTTTPYNRKEHLLTTWSTFRRDFSLVLTLQMLSELEINWLPSIQMSRSMSVHISKSNGARDQKSYNRYAAGVYRPPPCKTNVHFTLYNRNSKRIKEPRHSFTKDVIYKTNSWLEATQISQRGPKRHTKWVYPWIKEAMNGRTRLDLTSFSIFTPTTANNIVKKT